MAPLTDRKILITGATGLLARPVAFSLARDNEVWCLARFSDAAVKDELEAAGIRTFVWDLADTDLDGLPGGFTHVLHSAVRREVDDFDAAIEVNATGTARLMEHCRSAEAFCFVSNSSLYQRVEPDHRHKETDALGGYARYRPAYSLSKIVTEGTVRALANLFELPSTIARMNVGYGPYAWGGVPVQDFKLMLAGTPIKVPAEYENWCNPIHTDDVTRQVPLLWGVASVPATITNWGGDDMVSHREMMQLVSDLTGVPVEFEPGESPRETFAFDNTRRIGLIGPCEVGWRDGVRRTIAAFYPDAIKQ